VTFLTTTLTPKRLGLMHELRPTVTAVGFLMKPNNPAGESETKDAEAAARQSGKGRIDLAFVGDGQHIEL